MKSAALAAALTGLVACAHATPPFKAVLIAGDDSIPVFDDATGDFRSWLVARNLAAPYGIKSLSAVQSTPALAVATLRNIVAAISALRPAEGQGCLVFATSHGARNNGVFLAADKVNLTPPVLNAALGTGCGNAPTIVIISACYSGQFVRGIMRKPNRLILTAAHPDRTSFGCQAGRRYTVYDRCLLQSLNGATTWSGAYTQIRACVAEQERKERATPSEPQAFFGTAVPDAITPPQD